MVRLSAAVAAVLGSLMPGAALACSPPELQCPRTAPGEDVLLPANVPGLHVETSCLLVEPASECLDLEVAPEFLGPDGQAWPARIERLEPGWLVIPSALVPGIVTRLVPHPVEGACRPGSRGGRPVTITAVPAAPLPVRIGTLSLIRRERTYVLTPSFDGSCFEHHDGVQAVLRLDVSPELEPFLPVLRLQHPGGRESLGDPGEIAQQMICDGDRTRRTTWNVVVTGSLAGGPPLEPARLAVDLGCDLDAFGSGAGGGAPASAGGSPAGADPGGCTAAAANAQVVALLVTAVATVWRRRAGNRARTGGPARTGPSTAGPSSCT